MIELFQEWYNNHHEYAKAWKQKTGGKILGYFCPQVPEEILYAAEILPVCLPVSHEPRTMTEQHLSGKDCPLCRECLTQGLPDGYDYLDGVMISPSCPPIPEAIAPGLLHLPAPFCYFPS